MRTYSGLGTKKNKEAAMQYATELAERSARNKGIVPSKTTIARYSREEGPLSQFGLHPNLHYQCNVFNVGGDACGACQGCRAWLRKEQARAMTDATKLVK